MDGSAPDEGPPPAPPRSPFVSRLRGSVAAARQAQQWELQPSVGSWLTPRGGHLVDQRPAEGPRRVSFAEAEALAAPDDPQPPTPAAAPVARLELRVKGSSTKPFTLEGVAGSSTVAELKVLCESHCSLPAHQQRLLYKGKVLQDSQTLEGGNVPNKAVLFLVKGASAKPEPSEEAKDEADEETESRPWAQGFQGPTCVECGVNPGRFQTNGLCSICWREQVVKENKELKRRKEEAKRREEEGRREAEERRRREEELERRRQKDTSRCFSCRKRIGLTGFQCQCGYFYCATHRYAEEHACTFDHRAHGREILANQSGAAHNEPSR